MQESKIENLICDGAFSYMQPYFYNHPYALRCELGIGDEEYMATAKKRAGEIYDILFPGGADAIIFNYWIFDYSESGEAKKIEYEEWECDPNERIQNTLEEEMEQLKFLLEYQTQYRHFSVRNLKTYSTFDEIYSGKLRRNRIVCYSDGTPFDHRALIELQINGKGHEIGFVSFLNECILSVYDDRGCDIVFATHEKMKEFYPKLKSYFLDYDKEEMEQRFHNSKK